MLKHSVALIGFVVALAPALAAGQASSPPQSLYTDALAKEKAVRTALEPDTAPPTVLKAVRTVVAQYESVVRSYPTSGYCDDALWMGGRLALDAFEKFHEAQEKATATRLLRLLASEYPASKFAPQVAEQLKRADRTIAVQSPPSPPPAAPVTAVSGGSAVVGNADRPAIAPAAPLAAISPTGTPQAGRAPTAIATLKDIRRAVLPDVVRVVIELDGEVQFHEERLDNPSRVFIDLSSTRAAPALRDQTIRFDEDAEIVREVRLGRHPNDTTRVVLDAVGVSSFSVYPLYSPYRIVIDCARVQPAAVAPGVAVTTKLLAPTTIPLAAKPLASMAGSSAASALRPIQTRPLRTSGFDVSSTPRGAGADLLASARTTPVPAKPAGAEVTTVAGALEASSLATAAGVTPANPAASGALPSAPDKNIAGGFSIARQLGLGVSRIVIDPGHGGHDPGAKGNGLTEAELVLDVALRLEKLLSQVPGVEVVLTRSTDEFIPLQERTAIANRERADLFLSIHANASTTRTARGIESYFLNFATNPGAEAIAARENAGSDQAMAALPKLLNTIALNNKLDESRDLALMVQRAMIDNLKGMDKTVRDLGVKQAPFVVLIGAAMPSGTTEISFLTNAQEARLLKGQAYRQRIAEALFNAIRKYQTSLKSTGTIAARP